METKYYLIFDCGDGSLGIQWFNSKKDAEYALDNDEMYFGSNGIGSVSGIDLKVG